MTTTEVTGEDLYSGVSEATAEAFALAAGEENQSLCGAVPSPWRTLEWGSSPTAKYKGWMKKSAPAKGKDVVRGMWKRRYFVLKSQVLYCYMGSNDDLPQGHIPLRRARVERVDKKTGGT
ncbi:hypothetical protein AAMO2058_000241400 [Amorphochlora amoebiformis]